MHPRATCRLLLVTSSGNGPGVAFNVAMGCVLPVDSPADASVQYAAVEGTGSFGPEPGTERGYRGNGITFRIGATPGVLIKSSSNSLIDRLKVGITQSGIMLF